VLLKSVEELQVIYDPYTPSAVTNEYELNEKKPLVEKINRNNPISQLKSIINNNNFHKSVRCAGIRALGVFGVDDAEQVVPMLGMITSKTMEMDHDDMIQLDAYNALELINDKYKFANIDVLINAISNKTKIDDDIKQGQYFLEHDQREEALKRFEKALELAPQHPKALEGIAKATKQEVLAKATKQEVLAKATKQKGIAKAMNPKETRLPFTIEDMEPISGVKSKVSETKHLVDDSIIELSAPKKLVKPIPKQNSLKDKLQVIILNDILDFLIKNSGKNSIMSISNIDLLNPQKKNPYDHIDILTAYNELTQMGLINLKPNSQVGLSVSININSIEDLRKHIVELENSNNLLEKFNKIFGSNEDNKRNEGEDEDFYKFTIDTGLTNFDYFDQKRPESTYLSFSEEDGINESDLDLTHPRDLTKLSLMNIFSKDFDHAIEFLELALEKMPDYFEAWNLLGVIYCFMKDYKTGMKFIKKSLEVNKNSTDAWFNLSIVAEKLGLIDDAREYLTKATDLDPFNEDFKKRKEKLSH
ncbi:MAG: tetratricopeptide repeat protein, partial [Promethearchaeota archaeon]